MARSTRKTPIIGHTKSTSEKGDKAAYARAERTHVRIALANGEQPDASHKHRRCGGWTFAKDGRHWLPERLRSYGLMGK